MSQCCAFIHECHSERPQAAAVAALGAPLSPPFDAYGNDVLFYHAAFIFEDVGVTAYKVRVKRRHAQGLTAAGLLAALPLT